MEYTVEKSKEEAAKLKLIQETIMSLDEEYLSSALKDMRDNHSMRDDIAVLNPNPTTHFEQQELDESKLKQIELILKLRENVSNIINCKRKLITAKQHENEMRNIFGG